MLVCLVITNAQVILHISSSDESVDGTDFKMMMDAWARLGTWVATLDLQLNATRTGGYAPTICAGYFQLQIQSDFL